MAIGWMRLDTDFYRDEKFNALVERKGKGMAFDAIRLYCLCHIKYGVLDLNDPITLAWVEKEMGVKGKKLHDVLETLAEYRLISSEMLEIGKVTSGRLSKEGEKKRSTEEARQAAAKKRHSKASGAND